MVKSFIKSIVEYMLFYLVKKRRRYMVEFFLDQIQKRTGHIESITFNSTKDSKYRGRLKLLADGGVFLPFMIDGCCEFELIEFTINNLDRNNVYTVLDVGANVGYFTRHLHDHLLNERSVHTVLNYHLFEPTKRNSIVMKENVSLIKNAVCHEYALYETDGEIEFFLDDANNGNYSVYESAMEGRENFSKERVICKNVTNCMIELSSCFSDSIIFKCDTQGYDAKIVEMIPTDVWSRVDIAIIELWPELIRESSVDMREFLKKLSQFEHLELRKSGNSIVSELKEIEYFVISSNTKQQADLLCRR